MITELSRERGTLLAPSLVGGFAATTAMAATWLATHLPWLGIQEQVAIPTILFVWLGSFALFTASLPRARALPVGMWSGLISGLTGLVFFGSRLSPPANAAGVSAGFVPNAALLVLGFLALAIVLGCIGGLIGRTLAKASTVDQAPAHWLARFALLTAAASLPLIIIGGLVTSTKSGMAVPDWPNTYGSNMFLYPLGAHVQRSMGEPYENVFVEHAHRLFGMFVGLATIVLLVFTLKVERRRAPKIGAWAVLVLVVLQGVLGGMRVQIQSSLHARNIAGAETIGSFLAACHGVLAQLTVAVIVGFAVVLSDHYRALTPGQVVVEPAIGRRAKTLAAATMHALILQLIFGAIYRHFRSGHALLPHIGMSLIVLVLALIAGFTLAAPPIRRSIVGPRVAMLGFGLAIVVAIQFFLGWIALMTGTDPIPASFTRAVLRTLHHSNGALLLAFSAAAFVWSRRLGRVPANPPASAPAATAA